MAPSPSPTRTKPVEIRVGKIAKGDFAHPTLAAVSAIHAIDYHASMTAATKTRMSVNEYLAWARAHPGRYELSNGEVIAMSPEGAGHAAVKYAVQTALLKGIRARRLPCHMLPDGMTVRIDETTAYEPDALVYCGAKLAPSAVEVPAPVVVVEVLSPSTRRIDASAKLAGYFRLASVAHYLIVDPDKPLVVHHARGSGETILTRVVTQGAIELEPPGLSVALADFYAS
jgi:Uma2 family endonuclease